MAEGFEKEYSDDGFWEKLKRFAMSAGKEVVEKALWLYYLANDKSASTKSRALAVGGLGYFIFPLDAIPDVTPLVGFADDLGVLAMSVAIVLVNLTPAHRRQAQEKLAEWFPGDDNPPI